MAARVDGDANGGCELAGDASFLLCLSDPLLPNPISYSSHTFNSASVKPRPARTRRLYLMVGHRTMGLNLSIGRGATAADFARRALRRLSLRPGCISMSEPAFSFSNPSALVYLVEVNANPSLPILSEICDLKSAFCELQTS